MRWTWSLLLSLAGIIASLPTSVRAAAPPAQTPPANSIALPDTVTAVAAANDGRIFAVSGGKLYSMISTDKAPGAPIELGQTDRTVTIAFSPDGKTLAVSGAYDPIVFVDPTTQKVTGTVPLNANHGDVTSLIAWSPDGKQLATYSYKTVRISTIAAKTSTVIKQDHEVSALSFSNDGHQVLVATNAQVNDSSVNLLKVYDAGNAGFVKDIPLQDLFLAVLWVIPLDDTTVLVNGSDGIALVNTKAGKISKSWQVSGQPMGLQAAAISADKKRLATATRPGPVDVPPVFDWDTASGKPTAQLTGSKSQINALAISADGKTIVAGSDQGKVVDIWVIP